MAGAKKLGPYRDNKQEYGAGKKPRLVDVGTGRYLVAPGNGAPGEEVFMERMPPLYGMAYTLKFASKSAGRDYTVFRAVKNHRGDASWAKRNPVLV